MTLRSSSCRPLGEHREQVVEVVRDAARQLADRFHLLRLAKRRLGLAQPLLIAQRAR